MRRIIVWLIVPLAVLATPCTAQQVGSLDSTYDEGVLVTSADVLTCPYNLIRPIAVSVTEDYGMNAARLNAFGKLRSEAKKIGADAVVLVHKEGQHMTAFAFARREYVGNAISYVDRSCAPRQP